MPVACGSLFVVPVSQKGFGAGSSRPSNKKKQAPSQQKGNGILQTSSSDEKKQKKAVLLREGSQELHGVLKSVEKDHAKGRNSKLNIDNDIAAKGKVDFVKVESWGDASSSQGDLDNLKVKAFSPAFTSTDMDAPFYERLVYHLQLLESKGDISVVQAQSLPQFQNWAFGENRYLQYLIDQHAVFDALRFSISSLQNSISTDAGLSCQDAETKNATMAVGLFNEALGLDRCEALSNDIKSLSMAMSAGSTRDLELPKPTTQTVAYVKYLNQLARAACNENDGKQACLSILAHIFTIYVTHLTTGMRIGAKALDCLPVLKQAKGVNFYRDYPEHVKDPLKIFIASINKITDFVSLKEDQEQVMEELPKAMQKTSLLLVTLAVHKRDSIHENVH